MLRLRTFLAASLMMLLVTSCEKDDNDSPALRSKTEILTARPWVTQETYILEANTLTKYERGGTGNTINYDSEMLTFHSNGSGVFRDIYNATNNFTWNWVDAAQTRLRLLVTYPTTTATIDYYMVNLSEGHFTGTLSYTAGNGNRVLVSFRRIPQP